MWIFVRNRFRARGSSVAFPGVIQTAYATLHDTRDSMSDADNLEYRVALRHAGRVRTGDQSLGRKSPVENAVEALALPPSTPQAVRRKVYRLSLVSTGAVEG